jgi:hypothetical protein
MVPTTFSTSTASPRAFGWVIAMQTSEDAIDRLSYLDYVDQKNVHHINYYHVLKFKYMNLVVGFDP